MGLKSAKSKTASTLSSASAKVLPTDNETVVKRLASNKKSASAFLQRAGIITKSGALTSKYK